MKLNKMFNFNSLRNKFAALIVLVVVIPISITSAIVLSFLELDIRSQEESKRKIENQVKFTLVLALKNISSDAARLSQSNPFLDYLSVPNDLKVYSENRLYGITREVSIQSQLQPAFILLDAEMNEIFRFSNTENSGKIKSLNQLLSPGFSVDPSFLYYTVEIKLDDQQLQGPSARRQGFLIAIISLSELRKNIPELKEIVYLDRNLLTDKIKIEVSDSKFEKKFSLIYFLLATSGLLIFAVLFGVFFVNKKILSPISAITRRVQEESSSDKVLPNEDEIEILDDAIRKYQDNIKKNQSELIEQSKLSTLVSLASQVAHDIRSPLTALNMVISTLDRIPEEKRIIIRSAIQRINDIANDLLSRGKPARQVLSNFHFTADRESNAESYTNAMLSSLVDSLVSEKRIQFRDKINVMIDSELTKSYGLFSFIPPNELKTVLSNLINNAVEAFENESGRVILFLKEEVDGIRLEVADNGRGIPNEIIKKLGDRGTTFGKSDGSSGSGLGIFHAKKVIEELGGSIVFESSRKIRSLGGLDFDVNTTITILLPKHPAPDWFVEKVVLPVGAKIAVLDDDFSIHSVWQGRIASLIRVGGELPLVSFTSVEIFRKWARGVIDKNERVLFLIDYEFIGHNATGLDVIEELQIQNSSILVTSRYDEPAVLARCEKIGVPIVPKAMAGQVPITFESEVLKYDAILIDDDKLIHMTWNISANENGKKFLGFYSYESFLKNIDFISKDSAVYIDSNLGEKIRGESLAPQIFEMGFSRIFITTGYSEEAFEKSKYISAILGKEPVWDIS